MDVVMIPCWKRPEMLTLALERLALTEGVADHFYLFRPDRGHDHELIPIIERFPFRKKISFPSHNHAGNNFNVLDGFREALEIARSVNGDDGGYVHVIEEDVMVARDYFQFHHLAQRTFQPFVVTACESFYLMGQGLRATHEKESVYTMERYQGPNASFRRVCLEKLLHDAKPEYFADPVRYVSKRFPESQIGHGGGEQDILISNILAQERKAMLYPFMPRAYHAGWYGMTRDGFIPRGNLDERIMGVRYALRVPVAIESMNNTVYDVKPVPLDGLFAAALRLREFQPKHYL